MTGQDTINMDHPLMRDLRDALESLMLRRDLFIHCHDKTVKDVHAVRVDEAWQRYERAWNAVAAALAGTEATG